MTIIVYRDGIMAADSQITGGGTVYGHKRKIFRTKDGCLGAAAGHVGACYLFKTWADGDDRDYLRLSEFVSEEPNQFGAILVKPTGFVMNFDAKGRRVDVDSPWSVHGCAEEMAIGALAMGATAAEAVEICMKYDTGCGGDLQVESLDNVFPVPAA